MCCIVFYLTFVSLLLPTPGRLERPLPVHAAPSFIFLLVFKIRLKFNEKLKSLYRIYRVRFRFLNGIKRPGYQDSWDPFDLIDIFRLWNWR